MQDFFFLRINQQYKQVKFRDIIYAQAKRSGYSLVVTERETFLVSNTLSSIDEQLPREMFVKIHARYIVATARIEAFDRDWVKLFAAPTDKPYKMGYAGIRDFPMSIRGRKEIRERLNILMYRPSGQQLKIRRKLEEETMMEEMELDIP